MALGASPTDILRQIVREGLRLVLLGTLIGGAFALGAGRLMQSLLYGISSADWMSFGTGIVILGLVALAANILPAIAASRIDPIRALRAE
jgi:ABC-type antimicrobial peptide transport system permease subunit